MSWLTDRHCFLLAVVVYGVSMVYSVFLWRKEFRRDDHINYSLLLGAFLFHTRAMFLRGFSFSRCPVGNLFEAMVFVAWTIVAAYLVFGLWPRLRFLGAFAAPLVFAIGVFALMPDLDVPVNMAKADHPGLRSLHAALALLSYGGFGLSAVAALMYLSQEHDLKVHKLRAVLSILPPIERLEKIMTRLLTAGFALLTIGLAIGSILLRSQPHAAGGHDLKVPWSVLVWLGYLAILVLHARAAQIGRRFAWCVVGTFAFILLTFWGTNLLSPTHHFSKAIEPPRAAVADKQQ